MATTTTSRLVAMAKRVVREALEKFDTDADANAWLQERNDERRVVGGVILTPEESWQVFVSADPLGLRPLDFVHGGRLITVYVEQAFGKDCPPATRKAIVDLLTVEVRKAEAIMAQAVEGVRKLLPFE